MLVIALVTFVLAFVLGYLGYYFSGSSKTVGHMTGSRSYHMWYYVPYSYIVAHRHLQ